MKLSSPFVCLPYQFDPERMAVELAQFREIDWMSHPDKLDGNSALPLISSGGGDNNEFKGEMLPTRHLKQSPYLQQVIASFGEVFGRSRLMRLSPGCEVSPHVDFNHHWHHHVRIHIPVVTNPDVTFFCGDDQVHMSAGECWIFDSWRLHRVVNAGNQTRTHLVIDTAGSARFWETVNRAERAAAAATPLPARFVPYAVDQAVVIQTERFNLLPVMSPGDVDGLTYDLIADFESEPANNASGISLYKKHLLAYCKDWRALWYQYGVHERGWPHYQKLIDETLRTFPDVDPPLLVRGGNCRAKVAFMARVLSVALLPDLYREFLQPKEYTQRVPHGATKEIPTGTEADTTGLAAPGLTARREPARNERCACGSGLRYKHCHGASTSTN